MNEYVVGIDIGSSKVCAAAGKIGKNGELQIIGITSVNCSGMRKGIIVNIDNTSEAVKNCIEQLERMIDIKVTEVYISIPLEICELIKNKGVVAVASEDREITENDLRRVKKATKIINISGDKEIIDMIPEQYIVDGYDKIKDPVGMSGSRLELEAQLIVAQTTILNNIFKSINKAGLKIKDVVFQPIAIAEAVLEKEERDLGAALVDIGAETIKISIYKNDILKYTDIIALGGNAITNDIAVCLKIPFSESEKLKVKYSSSGKGVLENSAKINVNAGVNNIMQVEYKYLLDIMEARIEEILHIINKKLQSSGYYNEFSQVVFVGGGISLYKEIINASKEIIKKNVRIGSPEFVGASNPVYSVAVGVVKIMANLVKANEVKEEKSSENISRVWSKNKEENIVEENTIISRIKDFFTEFF